MNIRSENGLNDLPIDSIVLTFGYGAEPVRAVILSRQRKDGSYSVGREGDTAATSRIMPDDIVTVIHFGQP